jgi:dTDP-4-dehydrorhamnose 3,5-epimerase
MSLEVQRLSIPDVLIIRPVQHRDQRGSASETYNRRAFVAIGIDLDFVQDFQTRSTRAGTIRGLHFQAPPFAQSKLIRVLQGRIFDVAVDLRRSSPTFGKHVSIELSAEDSGQIFIPEGFAHGLCTLEPNTSVLYKLSNYYSPNHEGGVIWNDPDVGIQWPNSDPIELGDKDKRQPNFCDLTFVFE